MEQDIEVIESPLDRYLALRRRYLQIHKERKDLKIEMAREEALAVEMFLNRGIDKIELTDTIVRLIEKTKNGLKVEESTPKYIDDESVLPGQQHLSSMRDMQSLKAGQALGNQESCTIDDLFAAEEEDSNTEEPNTEGGIEVLIPESVEEGSIDDEILKGLSDGLI